MNLAAKLTCLFFLFSALSYAQNVSSSLQGVVVDPSGAPVPGAGCNLTSQATGLARAAQSAADGSFTFLNLAPGAYELAVQAPGFRTLEVKGIDLTASEIRTLGQLKLQLGEVRQAVSVTAESAPIQLGSAERSGTIDASQLNDVAIRGRDLFDLFRTLPGVVDTSGGRESVNRNGLGGIFVNGTRDNQKNATVDGMTNMDTGSNAALLYEPNMDSIQEVKILTSGYPAEFGRNSGAVITMVTKSGQKQFRGTAYDFYRHESLNANNFFNNRTGTSKLPYRYRITGYSLGGPILLPERFKAAKEKLFFFFTQEFTGGVQDNQNWWGTKFVRMPTEAERAGDFSTSVDQNGALLKVTDPLTRQQFPGNKIPAGRINSLGQAILKFFPLPNYTDTDLRQVNARNYRASYAGNYPRRQEMIRIDANLRPSITLFYRFLNDSDLQYLPWTHWVTGSVNYLLTPVKFYRPGRGQVVRLTSTLSPTLVNEFTFGRNQNALHGDLTDPQVAARSLLGNVPQWYQDGPGTKPYIPNLVFGGVPTTYAPNAGLGNIPYENWNHIYSFVDNLSKVWKTHQLKAGMYIEHTGKYQVGNGNYRGAFDFTSDVANPFDTGHSFANALLGQFRSYGEATARLDADWWFWNVEWYVQDNWRVNRRLTLDVGLRFYHLPPTTDKNGTMATFDPRYYDPKKAPALYVPALNAAGTRVAQDPITKAFAPAALIGFYVPGSGDYANGSRVGGKDGYPAGLYTAPWLTLGPRFGFAYDVFGKGKTAIRGAFGIFGDRTMGNPTYYTNGNPPVTYTPTLYYGDLATYAQAAGVIGPAASINALFDRGKQPMTMKFNFGVQQRLGRTALDASYVGGLSRHLLAVRNINPIPMFSHFDSRNYDPTRPGGLLPDNFFRPYTGYGEIRPYGFSSSSNYNALQVSAQRRFSRGLQFGIAYTWSKTLGVAGGDADLLSAYFPDRTWNYGPLNYDRTHMFVANYIYSVPKLGARFRLSAWNPITWVLDNWQVSGITSFLSGAPFTPGFTTQPSADITGSGETARITVVGDPKLSKSEKTFYRNFNTEVFQRTPVRSFGNAGVGILRNPGVNNWDISVSKRMPMRSEKRYLQFRGELFNVWNHTQFSGINSTGTYNQAGVQTNLNFGVYTAARNPRQIQLSLRLYF